MSTFGQDLANQLNSLSESIHVRDYHLADYQYELLCKYIKDFQDSLDQEHEVGLYLTAFGKSMLLYVTDIGYSNPYLLHFYGFYDGKESHLIQHINQLSFLLTTLPKRDPEKPAFRIGFATD